MARIKARMKGDVPHAKDAAGAEEKRYSLADAAEVA